MPFERAALPRRGSSAWPPRRGSASILLNYPDPKADPILEEALAFYLDEYFNISNRDLLGWR